MTAAPPWEPSAWMRGAIDRATKRIEAAGVTRIMCDVVVTPLGNGSEPGSREDRTCDRCEVYVPPGRELTLGTVAIGRVDGTRGFLVFGLCRTCYGAEDVA